jgi:hypothetical protein
MAAITLSAKDDGVGQGRLSEGEPRSTIAASSDRLPAQLQPVYQAAYDGIVRRPARRRHLAHRAYPTRTGGIDAPPSKDTTGRGAIGLPASMELAALQPLLPASSPSPATAEHVVNCSSRRSRRPWYAGGVYRWKDGREVPDHVYGRGICRWTHRCLLISRMNRSITTTRRSARSAHPAGQAGELFDEGTGNQHRGDARGWDGASVTAWRTPRAPAGATSTSDRLLATQRESRVLLDPPASIRACAGPIRDGSARACIAAVEAVTKKPHRDSPPPVART